MSETTDCSDVDDAALAESVAAYAINSRSNDPAVATDVQVQGLCRTETQIYAETTDSYLDELEGTVPPSPMEIERDLVKRTQTEFIIENRLRQPEKEDRAVSKGILLKLPQCLANMQVAMIVKRLHYVRAVQLSESDRDSSLLAIYEVDGLNEGLYVTSKMDMYRVVAQYNLSIDMRSFIEVQQILQRVAPLVPVSNGDAVKHLSVLANGIWNHQLQKLEPFSPDYVFLARTPATEYDENAQNDEVEMPDSGMSDVETWVEEPHDEPEIRVHEAFSVDVLKDRIREALADESFTYLDAFLDVAISHSVLAEECDQEDREITYAMMRDDGTGVDWLEVDLSDYRLGSWLGRDFTMDAVEEAIERNLALEADTAEQSQTTAAAGAKSTVSAEPVRVQRRASSSGLGNDYLAELEKLLEGDFGDIEETPVVSDEVQELPKASERAGVAGRATKEDNRKGIPDQCTVDQVTTRKETKAPPTKRLKPKGVNFDRLAFSAWDQLDDSTVQNDDQEYGG